MSPLQVQEKVDELKQQLKELKSLRQSELASYEAHKVGWEATKKVR